MRDLNSGEFRRHGRRAGQYSRRVRARYLQRLSDMWSETDGQVHQSRNGRAEGGPVRKARPKNWRATNDHGEVVLLEPNREFENVFEGGADPLMAALEYAAKKIREGDA